MSMCPVVLRLSRIVFRHFKSIVMCHQRPDVFLGPLPIINKLLVWVHIFVRIHIRKLWAIACGNGCMVVWTFWRVFLHSSFTAMSCKLPTLAQARNPDTTSPFIVSAQCRACTQAVWENMCHVYGCATKSSPTLIVCPYVILPLIFWNQWR